MDEGRSCLCRACANFEEIEEQEEVAGLDIRREFQELRFRASDCSACGARSEAIRPVPPAGDARARVMIVGRNPGAVEDKEGVPFVGPSGRRLNWFLQNAGLKREKILITNLVLCHTLNDRRPTHSEISACSRRWLAPLIELIRPKVILTMGGQAMEHLLGVTGVTRMHGQIYKHMAGYDVIPCIHPGAPLRDPKYQPMVEFDEEVVRKYVKSKALAR